MPPSIYCIDIIFQRRMVSEISAANGVGQNRTFLRAYARVYNGVDDAVGGLLLYERCKAEWMNE